jgi:lysophospholipase L1-like esterase
MLLLCRQVPDCDWDNPTIPAQRHDDNTVVTAEWNYAVQFNIRHIQSMTANSPEDDNDNDESTYTKTSQEAQSNVDVVLIGDSIVEHWEGKDMGINEASLHPDHEVFEELFSKKGGGQIDGMAHGIGGDRCSNLLWRLQNGEMPLNFEPKVWWILIGTEDWRVGVGSEAIVAGIVNIVTTIRQAHPTTHIVINSILPRGNEKRNENPHYAALFDINRRLACFVDSENARHQAAAMAQDQDAALVPVPLTFFNATSIFLFLDPEVGYFVNPALLPDYVHPSAQGETIWGEKIVEMILNLTANNIIPSMGNSGASPVTNNP